MTKTVDHIPGIPTQKSIQRDEKHEQNGDSDSDVESADSPPLVLKYLGKEILQTNFIIDFTKFFLTIRIFTARKRSHASCGSC